MNKFSSGNFPEIPGGGLILTFDDAYISEWEHFDETVSFPWKATFYISSFGNLSKNEINILLRFQEEGHEIGFHGEHHIKAPQHLRNHSSEEYLDYEIKPGLEAMFNAGLRVTSFAYPYGLRNRRSDQLLSKEFTTLRGTVYDHFFSRRFPNMVESSHLLFGLGLDRYYGLSRDKVLQILNYAHTSQKIAVFYAHGIIGKPDRGKFKTVEKDLLFFCEYAHRMGLRFLTPADLRQIHSPETVE